jgi:hypothetical protein
MSSSSSFLRFVLGDFVIGEEGKMRKGKVGDGKKITLPSLDK